MNRDLLVLESDYVEITTNHEVEIFELKEYQLIVSTNVEGNIYNSDGIDLWLANQY